MFGRVVLIGAFIIAVSWANSAVISDGVIGPEQTALRGGCSGDPTQPPIDPATCSRYSSDLDVAGKITIEVISLAIVGILLLLSGFFLTKPPPDPPLTAEDVSSEWRKMKVPAIARIIIFGLVLTLFSAIAGSVVVPAVVLAFFASLLALRRQRLTPDMMKLALLLSLGLAASLIGYFRWGILGFIAIEDLVITIAGAVIALSFLRY